MRVLFTNDDGYVSPLYNLLAKHLLQESWISSLTLVAPAYEQSWIGTAITTHSCVKHEIIQFEGKDIHILHGTPADCATIGSFNILETPPDLIISGINFGSNAGSAFATSSGTLAAARQAAYLGIPGIACSAILEPDTRKAWKNKDLNFLETKKAELIKIADLHINLIRKCVDTKTFRRLFSVADYVSINSPRDIINDNLHLATVKDTRYVPFFEKQSDGSYIHGFKGFQENISGRSKSSHSLPLDMDLLEDKKSTLTLFRLDTGDLKNLQEGENLIY